MSFVLAGPIGGVSDPVADATCDAPEMVGEVGDVDLVGMLAEMEPGPGVMALLASIDVSALDVDGRIEVAAAWERQQGWVAAQSQRALAAVVADLPEKMPQGQHEEEWRSELVAASLRWSTCTASGRLFMAQRLVEQLAPTFGLLEAGEISFRHAQVVADAVGELTAEERAFVQGRVLEHAPSETVARFTRRVKRAVLAAAPELAAARRERAMRRDRDVRLSPGEDGMAVLIATMGAAEAQTVFEALQAVARKAKAAAEKARAAVVDRSTGDASRGASSTGDSTGATTGGKPASTNVAEGLVPDEPVEPVLMGGLRVDALVAWAADALANPDLPRRQGRRVEVQVVVDLPTLLGMVDHPAELIGYGPIPAQAARELCADATWRRLVVDAVDGHLLDYGSVVYRPPQRLVDYVVARDRRCRFPGCGRRADACDVDHVCPHGQAGGKTAACNCCTLCRKHHRAKTHGGWRLEIRRDGSAIWTAPGGRVFHVDPVNQLE